jgi:hypothetical protein
VNSSKQSVNVNIWRSKRDPFVGNSAHGLSAVTGMFCRAYLVILTAGPVSFDPNLPLLYQDLNKDQMQQARSSGYLHHFQLSARNIGSVGANPSTLMAKKGQTMGFLGPQ